MTTPPVAIIMGSQSDWATMKHAADTLAALDVGSETLIVSAHRTPERLFDFAKSAKAKGFKIIIAGAGGAAHLPGMTASLTSLPVFGVPIETKAQLIDELASGSKPKAEWKIADIGAEDTVVEAGGLGRKLRAYRLPEENPHRAFAFDVDVGTEPGKDNPIYVRVTLEDGHQAWSSPIYVIP